MQIDKGREPLEELTVLLNFVKTVANDKSILHEKVQKDYQRFFYDDFSNGLLKRLTREKSNDERYLTVISQFLETYLALFISEAKDGHFNQQFLDSIKMIFDCDSILHSQNYQISENELSSIRSSNQQWRQDLKVGDMVDAIQDDIAKCTGWSQAAIDQINGDVLHLQFLYDEKRVHRYLDRWSVEIAPYESKTKEVFEWKKSLKEGVLIDAHDKSAWNKSTILKMQEETVMPGRTIIQAYVAFRVYMEKGPKIDDDGKHYDGWSSRFDEWVPLYSPRIMPFYTKTQKGVTEEYDIDEELDKLFKPEEGHNRVYAVPRLRKCISSCYIHLLNQFGEWGGFDLIKDTIERSTSNEESGIDLNVVGSLMECISKPYLIYHSEFQKQYCPNIINLAKKALRDAPEKQLRDVKREKIESMIKSVDLLQRRTLNKDEREKETETLKLDVCLMCLRANFLERRIQGIRELNQIIRNNRMLNNKSLTNQQIVEWLEQNDVYNIIFDNKKTHLQIVQRSSDIMKLLLQENQLSEQLLEMFWNLSKTDYKFEVYKIINEIAFYLKQNHIGFIFEQIRHIPPEKLAIEEFTCLSELGKYSKEDSFKVNISDFFWSIICNSEQYKDELVNSCILKFCEMVKLWEISKKHQFFVQLIENLKNKKSSISSLKLFKGLIQDEKKGFYSVTDPQSQNSPQQVKQDQITSLNQSIETLIQEHQLVQVLLDNLKDYCYQINVLIGNNPYELQRKKLNLVNQQHNHHDEIDERLSFLKYIASISEFKISKEHLGVIYELLVKNSKVQSDSEEFLTWCKSSCEQSSISTVILDLNEVGEFFTERMQSGELDVKNLLLVGFDFLQQYFLSMNEKEGKLIKSTKSQPKKNNLNFKSSVIEQDESEERGTVFKLIKSPSELHQLDIIWSMALKCENSKVVPKAIDFLIKVYTSLDEDLNDQKIPIQDELIEKCMKIINEQNDEYTIKRTINIIKHIIAEAEKKGTGDVQPHNAVLKGELLDKVLIKNRASSTKGNIIMSVYSNCTVWEFRKEVAKFYDLAPKYLKLERNNGDAIKDLDNGKTLAQLSFQYNEQITAFKVQIEEEIANAPLIGQDSRLTEKAKQIFNEWFDMYSNEDGRMTRETCALFVKGCTNEQPTPNDERISNLFKSYDSNNDGFIEREEFLQFYESSARSKPETVRENLKAHNIRNDLKKLSEIQEESSYSYEDMPRYKIAKHQLYFDTLMSLLDRHDSASQESWDLIQMLATNQVMYTRVLELKTGSEGESTGEIDWEKFFDSHSVYKLLYTLEIIEAVMEEGEGSQERIKIFQATDVIVNQSKKVPQAPPLQGVAPSINPALQETISEELKEKPAIFKKATSIVEDEAKDKQLRKSWTQMFLNQKGFQYILNVFLKKDISQPVSDDSHISSFNQVFELKHVAFLLKLLRIFIMAAFSTSPKEQTIYETATLIRKSSSSVPDDLLEEQTTAEKTQLQDEQAQEGSTFKELQKLLKGSMGDEIIESINYQELQGKILVIISQILTKKELIYEDKLIIENALSLWAGCLLHNPVLINDFYQFKDYSQPIRSCNDFILTGLLYCPYEKVREEFRVTLVSISQQLLQNAHIQEPPLYYLLRLLCDNFALINQYQCKQYFEMFCDLIDFYFSHKSSAQIFDPEQLLSLIIDKIHEYNQASDNSDEGKEEQNAENENIYIGLIQLTSKIIDNFDISLTEKVVEQKSLIDEIFSHFLFASVFKEQSNQANSQALKIKVKQLDRSQQTKKTAFGKRSKDSAYKLLNSLIRKSSLLMNTFLQSSMLPLIKQIRRIDQWNYLPPNSSERFQKYVGLRNLGCICYMNSMLQQFFMIPAFRYNLLSVDDKQPELIAEYKGHKIDDNVLHQLQKLMAHLELSERQDYNPFEFCFAFKEFDGQPTNTAEQKDAQEFLNVAFERIENLLKPTSRKYLLNSVFGGQTVSQLLCTECGKVKNRVEDFTSLSLTVKDIKSMKESLSKQLQGEVINDYQCEGCNKKVDIQKRTLISQTPNVLIVHLQRIIFNFDTFRNDKINSFFEFPLQLDLKPFSFYEVMGQEGKLKQKKEGEDDEQEEVAQHQQQQDEDNQWPAEEDCFEYKLVGVNVHSGTANAGHYWSYINTRRGFLEPQEGDQSWAKTEQEPWMEFNDSTVRDFNFEKIKDECYGGDKSSSDDSGWSFGGSYGKSAYMLIYERRKKRPLKILVTDEEEKQLEGVQYDQAKDEHFKLIDYREGVEDLQPNNIYKQVFEDNKKFEFENDIYSQEFFEFIKGILIAVANLDQQSTKNERVIDQMKSNSLLVAKKAIFDILAKCYNNAGIKEMSEVFTQILQSEPSLPRKLLESFYNDDQFTYLYQLLLECPDIMTRQVVSNILQVVLIELRNNEEKDILYEKYMEEVKDEKEDIKHIEQYKALSSRFIMKGVSQLNTLVAKNWSKFDSFFEILYAFATGEIQKQDDFSSRVVKGNADKKDDKDINKTEDQITQEERGLEFFFKHQFIEKTCDFLLGKKSPLCKVGEKRIDMGGSISSPNYSALIKILTKMIQNEPLLVKYPMSDIEKKMFLNKELLKVMLGSSQGSKQFGNCLANMCKENEKLSRKVSKVFLNAINHSNYESVKNYLKALKPFLLSNDSLKEKKLEWIFGFSQILAKKGFRESRYKFGLELINDISEQTMTFLSTITESQANDALLSQLLKCKGRLETFAINCLKELLSLMAKDDQIARFFFKQPSYNYLYARYTDWMEPYLIGQQNEMEKGNSYNYIKSKYDKVLKCLKLVQAYQEKCRAFYEEEKEQFNKFKEQGFFANNENDWPLCKDSETIPTILIGKQIDEEKTVKELDENPHVKIIIQEIKCEFALMKNQQRNDLEVKMTNYNTLNNRYNRNINQMQKMNLNEDQGEEKSEKIEPQVEQIDWQAHSKIAPILLRFSLNSKSRNKVVAKVQLINKNENQYKNCSVPITCFKEMLTPYSEGTFLCHITKIDPTKDWDEIDVIISVKEINPVPQPPQNSGGHSKII